MGVAICAQGSDARLYPWGNEWRAAAVPTPEKSRTLRGPDDVSAHPQGASPFGVMDMVGNVWQWTDEYFDEHTRAAILRGGSYYNRKDQCGTSRKRIATISTASCSSWRRRRIGPGRSAFVVSSTRSEI